MIASHSLSECGNLRCGSCVVWEMAVRSRVWWSAVAAGVLAGVGLGIGAGAGPSPDREEFVADEPESDQQPATSLAPLVASSALPRRTEQGVVIVAFETTEVLGIPGCSTLWAVTSSTEPPPGACQKETEVSHVSASMGDRSVDVSVVGQYHRDPLFVVSIVVSASEEGLSVVVASVAPGVDVDVVRLLGPGGDIVDQVRPEGQLVALAAPEEVVTVEALDATRTVVGSCPQGGVSIDGIVYRCTLAPGAKPPVTTVPVP